MSKMTFQYNKPIVVAKFILEVEVTPAEFIH